MSKQLKTTFKITNIDYGTCSDAIPVITLSDGYCRYTIRGWIESMEPLNIKQPVQVKTYAYP